MKYAIIYCRVATENCLAGYTIADQETMMREYAQSEGYEVLKIFSDANKSATSMIGRDALHSLLEFIQNELTEIDRSLHEVTLFVRDIDRLARTEEDYFRIRSLLKKCKVQVRSKDQPKIDESPEGRLLDSVLMAVNAFESRIHAEKVREGQRKSKKKKLGY